MNMMYNQVKAFLSIVSAAAILVSGIFAIVPVLPASAAQLGDLVADGAIDMFDAMALYSAVSGMSSLSAEQKAVADIDNNGEVDMFDALYLYRAVSGQSELPESETTTTPTKPSDVMGEVITYTVASATASVGDIVEIPLSVTDNHYMIHGQLYLQYDPAVLELQKVCEGDNPYFESVNRSIFKSSTMWSFGASTPGMTKFAFASGSKKGSATGGMMYTLTFKVIAEAPEGSALTLTIPTLGSNDGTTNGGKDYHTDYEIVHGIVTTV